MREGVEYVLFLIVRWIARRLPFSAAGRIGKFLGAATFRLVRYRRSTTIDNLHHAFPALGKKEILGIAAGAYRNYGIALVEMLWAGGAAGRELMNAVSLVHPEIMYRAKQQGRGVLLLSGHFGSWELIVSSLVANLGIPFRIIVQRQRNRRIDALVDADRSRFGNSTIPMGPSVREVLKALREDRTVAMLGDQSGPKEAVFVEFFGRPAATHRGIAAFHLKTGAPIVMVFLIRKGDGTYDAVFEELDLGGLAGTPEEKVIEITRRHTALLEREIRAHPDHWLWMHKRWKHTGFYESTHEGALHPAGEEAG